MTSYRVTLFFNIRRNYVNVIYFFSVFHGEVITQNLDNYQADLAISPTALPIKPLEMLSINNRTISTLQTLTYKRIYLMTLKKPRRKQLDSAFLVDKFHSLAFMLYKKQLLRLKVHDQLRGCVVCSTCILKQKFEFASM